jgi:uncharacterized membrane protein (DUF4010 family)
MDFIEPRFLGLAVAFALGLLVGLQREFASKRIGIRSFALISTIGGIVGLFAADYGGWVLACGLLAVTLALYGHAYLVARTTEITGMTTELAAIAMFLIGAMATSGQLAPAVVLGGTVTLLLHWKSPLHTSIRRVGAVESEAIGRFVLIALVVLPILPDRAFGPYGVLNPRQIWLMVVLIVGLNLAGYIALKFSRGRGGVLLSGVLGGLISSTATTVGMATRSRGDWLLVPIASIVILIASALVYVRILIETTVVAPALVPALVGPVLALGAVFGIAIGVEFMRLRTSPRAGIETSNPAEIKSALSFTLLYGGVLFVSAAVNAHFGDAMLYPVALVSGLTDVDAITLSVAHLFARGQLEGGVAWRLIFVASLSNIAFKTGVVVVLGGARLRQRFLPWAALLVGCGVAAVYLWP